MNHGGNQGEARGGSCPPSNMENFLNKTEIISGKIN